MSVTIKNDGKHKQQSFSATLEIPHTNTLTGYFTGEIVAFGATADEARHNLEEVVKAMNVAVSTAGLSVTD